MPSLVVRRLDQDVKERLRKRAVKHGRSLEAEVREILAAAAREQDEANDKTQQAHEGFGTLMQEHFGKRGLTRAEQRRMEQASHDIADKSEMIIPDIDEW